MSGLALLALHGLLTGWIDLAVLTAVFNLVVSLFAFYLL